MREAPAGLRFSERNAWYFAEGVRARRPDTVEAALATDLVVTLERLARTRAQSEAPVELVRAWHEKYGQAVRDKPTADVPADELVLRINLHREEIEELELAMHDRDVIGIADALGDLLYVLYGHALSHGIDIEAVFAEVHRSNMTKEPGPTGKAVKGARYSPPDVAGVLARFAAMAATGEAVPA